MSDGDKAFLQRRGCPDHEAGRPDSRHGLGVFSQGLSQRGLDFREIERLYEVSGCPTFSCLDGILQAAVSRDDHDRQIRRAFAKRCMLNTKSPASGSSISL